jgi:dienelactone hydrolase
MLFLRLIATFFLVSYSVNARAETLRFKSSTVMKGWTNTIEGELSFPRGPGPFPGIIFMHGCGGLRPAVRTSLRNHARYMAGAGFATLILDSFSARKLNDGKVCDPTPLAGKAIFFRRDDAFNALNAMREHPKIQEQNIFLAGQSHGAEVGLHAALNLADQGEFRAIAAFYPNCRPLTNSAALKAPIIVFSGGKDDWTPVHTCTYAKKIDRMPGAEFELVVYPDALHLFDVPGAVRMFKGHALGFDAKATTDSRNRMRDFFVRHLRSSKQQ